MNKFAIALHGGAGVIPKSIDQELIDIHYDGLTHALIVGETILKNGGTALDAVEATVKALEDNPKFNAGKGAVFSHTGDHEMDASIMDGSNLKCGAVSQLTSRKNPIQVARLVMEKTNHVYLGSDGAEAFAEECGLEKMDADYFFDQYRYDQFLQAKDQGVVALDHNKFDDKNQIKKKGTVGAVALDSFGNIAAATSTGGMTNKKFGRIGDSPIIGAGTFADNSTCAISCTGDGEEFIRNVVAYDVHSQIKYQKKSLKDAVAFTIHKTLDDDIGGLIAVNQNGQIVMDFNTIGMFRAWSDSKGDRGVKIWE
jgi:beta-aspartyl-peptidase (threonine type)